MDSNEGCIGKYGSISFSDRWPAAGPGTCTSLGSEWFHEELGESWEVVAQYLGDTLTTVLNHYVRAGEDALRDSVRKLDSV